MALVNTQQQRPSVDFTWSPSGLAASFTVGGTTFPYTHQQDGVTRASDSRYLIVTVPSNTPITFTAITDAPQGIIILEYNWDFGDGQTGYGPVVTHEYRTVSPQTQAVLRVLDNRGTVTTRFKVMNLHAGSRITVAELITVDT